MPESSRHSLPSAAPVTAHAGASDSAPDSASAPVPISAASPTPTASVPSGAPGPGTGPVAAPRFSVIIPAHGVAGHLAQALDSVLGQALRPPGGAGAPGGAGGVAIGAAALGVEVIPVCGAADSLDAVVAARYARQDPRVKPVWSPPEAGLSGARNTGIGAASGDYLLFLDGDDTLAPGALAAVDARLRETSGVAGPVGSGSTNGAVGADGAPGGAGGVDVLYVGHERVHWWKGPQPGDPVAEQMPDAPDGAFAPGDVPGFTGTALPAWSAVHRRAFLTAHDLVFPAGSYTDVGFGGLEVLAASRVAVLPGVCVRHLLRRQGNRLLKESGEHHFDLLDQVDLVLTRAGEQGGGGPSYALFAQLTAQVLKTAAAAPEVLPDGGGRAFFARASELYRRHLPDGFRAPGGRLGVQHRLLAAGAYGAFAALRGARRGAGRAVRDVAASAARARAHAPRRRTRYDRELLRPIDENLAVYCSYWGRGYSCNPAAIHAAARRLAPHIRSVFLVTEEAAEHLPRLAGATRSAGATGTTEGTGTTEATEAGAAGAAGTTGDPEYVVIGSPRYWEVLARAKYLINNANFANAVVKRPGTIHLQTQHGTPLKRMGIEQAEYPVVAAHSGSFRKLLERIDRWDYNLSSNRHSTEVWEREFPAGYEMLEYGYPRNDVYQRASAADVARVRRELGVPEDRTAILYAPTHRDYRTSFRSQLDLEAFCDAVGEEFVVLLRAHYFYETGGTTGLPDRVIDVTGHPSAEEVCLAADALVTDYSSIMFDYANLDRPIVVYADDWHVYRETRGVTFDVTRLPPGPVATTEAEVARVFWDGTWAGERSARLRSRFRERFCTFDDGFAAERVVRRVLLGEPPEALPPIVPLPERTPAPAARPAHAPHRARADRAAYAGAGGVRANDAATATTATAANPASPQAANAPSARTTDTAATRRADAAPQHAPPAAPSRPAPEPPTTPEKS